MVLADYAAADAVTKVNVLGAGWQVAGIQPGTGLISPQAVAVLIELPPRHVDEQFALTLLLMDDANQVVEVPGPTGAAQALRISQLVKVEQPSFPGLAVPRGVVPGRVQMVVNFPGGLSLAGGHLYSWQVDIDGQAPAAWRASFYVAGPPPPLVVG